MQIAKVSVMGNIKFTMGNNTNMQKLIPDAPEGVKESRKDRNVTILL